MVEFAPQSASQVHEIMLKHGEEVLKTMIIRGKKEIRRIKDC